MKKLAICAALFLYTSSRAVAGDIYVSPQGDDAHAGTLASPLRSPEKALRMAREWRRLHRDEARGGITIHMAAGTYRLSKALFLRPEDSGTPESPTVIQGEADGSTVISGGVSVGGWRRGCADERVPKAVRGRVWTAPAPVKDGRIVYARQLWVGESKAQLAQQNAADRLQRIRAFDAQARTVTIPTPAQSIMKDAGRLEMLLHQRWAIAILRVKSIADRGDGTSLLTFHEPESTLEFEHPWPQPVVDGERGSSAFNLMNAPQLLDEPGEWYQDYPSGTIYYLPREGEDMTKAEAVVPAISRLVTVDGLAERTVHDILFSHVTFAHAAWTEPSHQGLVTLQGGFPLIDAYKLLEPGLPEKASLENQAWIRRPEAAVSVDHAQRVGFTACAFRHMGATALDMKEHVSHSHVRGSSFTDIGGNGIMTGAFPDGGYETHVPYGTAARACASDSITISGNTLQDITNEDYGAVGIAAGYVSNILIEGNTLSHLNYSGICVGWGWTPLETGMRCNRILGNTVTHYARQLYDAGGIYTLSAQPGSIISGNTIAQPTQAPYATNWRAFDIYFDEATDGYTVENNRCSHHYGYNQPGPAMQVKDK